MQATLHHPRKASDSSDEEPTTQIGLCSPDQLVADQLWCLIIGAFVFVLVGTFLALTAAIFLKVQTDLLLTVFTSVTTFLAGLATPSPLARRKSRTRQ